MTTTQDLFELDGDLDFILRDALDRIDLAVHHAGLEKPEALNAIRAKFGAETARRWLDTREEREAEDRKVAAMMEGTA